jgi:deoxyribodipyrimidine photo-lyase
MWFRENDLRCHDNTALYHASLEENQEGLLGFFMISPYIWKAHDMSSLRQEFLLKHLETLRADLALYNIPLLIETVTNEQKESNVILKTIQKHHIHKLFYNQQFAVNEQKRDDDVKQYCLANDIAVKDYIDHIIFKPDEILSTEKKRFTIFTPFKKVWLSKLDSLIKNDAFQTCPTPKKQNKFSSSFSSLENVNLTDYYSYTTHFNWRIGENHALKILDNFIEHKIKTYHKTRDYPAIEGTSKLSPYLASGIISPRQCVEKIAKLNQLGANTWLSELIWREFYHHVLFHFPRVSMHKPYKLITDKIHWETNTALFNAWKNAQTGFPLIDAAMNQLNQTGWMHNRLRMLTASFLAKNLLIDWRKGEKYFMQKLIDGDLAANNGGWQWCASTGTDAVPYFRIFNPLIQTKKFDPNMEFIKQYCPDFQKKDYPKPIIDLGESRKRALAAYKQY